jgi:hypothetical protein
MPGPGHEIVSASRLRDESIQLQHIMLWMFGDWGYRSRWFNRTRPIGQRKHTDAMNARHGEQHA